MENKIKGVTNAINLVIVLMNATKKKNSGIDSLATVENAVKEDM
jgi:hypothetical protein